MQLYEAKTEVLKTSVISAIGTYRLETCSVYWEITHIAFLTYLMFYFMKFYHDWHRSSFE